MGRPKGSKNKHKDQNAQPAKKEDAQVDSKLLNIQAFDELIADRKDELSKIQDRIQNREAYLQTVEADIDLKKRESNRDILTRREVFEEELGKIRNDLMVRDQQIEMIERSLADREADLVVREEAAAKFDEERRQFEDRSLRIRQAEMVIEDRVNEAEGLKREYEARISSILKLQDDANTQKQHYEKAHESLRVRSTDLDNREKKLKVDEQALRESESAFRRQINGSKKQEVKV